jgi:GH24 family phage-related lysozyme (muramidase)
MSVAKRIKPLLLELEHSTPKGYVPSDNSGVTIAKGLDLKEKTVEELEDMGLSSEMVRKLSPYLTLSGQEARDLLKASPLEISKQDEIEINNAVLPYFVNKLDVNLEKYTGKKLDEYPNRVQDALALQYFNLGNGLFVNKGKKTNFSRQLEKGEYKDAAKNLQSWTNREKLFKDNTRGLAVRQYLAGEIMSGDVSLQQASSRLTNLTEQNTSPDVEFEDMPMEGNLNVFAAAGDSGLGIVQKATEPSPEEDPEELELEPEETAYRVQSGDSLSAIYDNLGLDTAFGISKAQFYDQMFANNPEAFGSANDARSLKAGAKLKLGSVLPATDYGDINDTPDDGYTEYTLPDNMEVESLEPESFDSGLDPTYGIF